MKIILSGRGSPRIQLSDQSVQGKMAGVVRWTSDALRRAGTGAAGLVERMPATIDTGVDGGLATTNALQRLPDSTLRWLTAGSVGLGAGLYLTGAPRLVVATCVMPALVMAAAILLRPVVFADPGKPHR